MTCRRRRRPQKLRRKSECAERRDSGALSVIYYWDALMGTWTEVWFLKR